MLRRLLCAVALLASVSAWAGRRMLLGVDGGIYLRDEVKHVWKKVGHWATPRVDKLNKGVEYTLCYGEESYYYCPERDTHSIWLTWFTPPAECSVEAFIGDFYSPGDCKGWITECPTAYSEFADTHQLYDSIRTWFVYDSLTGTWTTPTKYIEFPITSASSADGDEAWTEVDFGASKFDVGMNDFFVAIEITDVTGNGRPWPLSDDNAGVFPLPRAFAYRVHHPYGWTDWYFNQYGLAWGDLVGYMMYGVVVDLYGNPPPFIDTEELPYTYSTGPYTVRAEIVDLGLPDYPAGVQGAQVIYWVNSDTTRDTVDMTLVEGADTSGLWEAVISPVVNVGDTVHYYCIAWDIQPRYGRDPVAGDYSFVILQKTPGANRLLVMATTEGEDPYAFLEFTGAMDTIDTLYDVWWAEDYLYPDSSVINSYNMVIWATWSDGYIIRSEPYLRMFLDNGGNLFLSGQDVLYPLVGTYDSVGLSAGNFCYDYLKFGWVKDDNLYFYPNPEQQPVLIAGIAGDPITDTFSVPGNWLLYWPETTWTGGRVWIGTAGGRSDIPSKWVPTPIFIDEYGNYDGFRYVDIPKGYKYVLDYFLTGAIADTSIWHPVADSPTCSYNAQQLAELAKNMYAWFNTPVPIWHDAFMVSITAPDSVFYDSSYSVTGRIGNYSSDNVATKVYFVAYINDTEEVWKDSADITLAPEDYKDVEFKWTPNVCVEGVTYKLEFNIAYPDSDTTNNRYSITVSQITLHELNKYEFVLFPALPNPMTQRTFIKFGVPERTHVSLKIYDITGRLVRTLKDATLDAGYYTVTWDGRDNKGRPVATGVYFYRLEAAGKIATKKLVRLK